MRSLSVGCCGNRSQGAPCCWGVCGDRLSRGLPGGEGGLPGGSAIRRVVADVAFRGLLTGSTMLLRETSLMPPVPGLPALLSMLFAPVMELRCVQPSALSVAFVKREPSGRDGPSLLLERKQEQETRPRHTLCRGPLPWPRCDESSYAAAEAAAPGLTSARGSRLTQTRKVSPWSWSPAWARLREWSRGRHSAGRAGLSRQRQWAARAGTWSCSQGGRRE